MAIQPNTSKPIRTTRRGARAYVQSGTPFKTSNGTLFGRWVGAQSAAPAYVVYSYGEHWPLFVYCADVRYENEGCYENEGRRSMTTSHHRSYAHPHRPTELRSTSWLLGFVRGSRV